MDRTLRDWVEEYARDRGAFAAAYPGPFLLLIEVNAEEAEPAFGFQTMRLPKLGANRRTAEQQRAAPVVKRAGSNAFAMMITVGRAQNNDIVIDAPSISKFHAFFAADGKGGWTLQDAGSSNGTAVDGEPLAPRLPRPLRDGAQVSFAGAACRFLLPETARQLFEDEAAAL